MLHKLSFIHAESRENFKAYLKMRAVNGGVARPLVSQQGIDPVEISPTQGADGKNWVVTSKAYLK
jgi:hypothetical protein